jgi:hypothetical protein
MFQRQHDFFHGHLAFEDEPARIKQSKPRDQTQDKMTLIGIFRVSLTSLRCQQVLHEAKHLLHPVALIPSLNHPGHLDVERHRDEVKRLCPRLVDDHKQNLTISATSSPHPHIATARGMETGLPGPRIGLNQVRTLDLLAIFKGKGIGAFALHPQGALMRVGDMAHELGVAEPTIGHQHRLGQRHAAFGKGRQALIEHVLGLELVLAFAPRPFGIGAADGKVNRDDQFAIANDHEPQDPINAKDGSLERATPPAAHEAEVAAVFSAHRIVDDPSPLPTALGGGTLGLSMAPDAQENLKAQTPEPFEPGAFGESAQEFGGDILIPSPHACEFMKMSSAKESGKHDANDFAQELLLSLQAAFNLGDEGIGEAQIL